MNLSELSDKELLDLKERTISEVAKFSNYQLSKKVQL